MHKCTQIPTAGYQRVFLEERKLRNLSPIICFLEFSQLFEITCHYFYSFSLYLFNLEIISLCLKHLSNHCNEENPPVGEKSQYIRNGRHLWPEVTADTLRGLQMY